ncbi:MAG TPA: tRNA epoxyqueuosine(34) reductase QueG [Candidatus Saccharimonadales bacterium]|jgi:epoxyqueuosine reductase|nr:tRNA epoxyqueuosine(34) reductase QueG [Candidatus Saccharimonadales bacterium]
MVTSAQLAQIAKQAAAAADFDLAGVASVRAEDLPELEAFPEWIEAGHAGEMKYLEKRTDTGKLRRASLQHAAPWARSVIVCAMNYNTDVPYSTEVRDPARGWISRYALGPQDYHSSLLPRLRQVEAAVVQAATVNYPTQETALPEMTTAQAPAPKTWCYVDTGPVIERVYAKYAGIGWIGKNTCIIHPKLGSWVFLGVILTSLEIAADLPAPDRCGSCTRCIDACPTQALIAPGKMDARRCIAYLTIEKRGEIPEEFRDDVGHQVFGCDICQDVCPWNNKSGNAPAATTLEFQASERLVHPELAWLAGMTQEEFSQTFRGSPVKRTKFSGMKRNVAVAMGNSGNREFLPALERLAADQDATVAEHARWAIEKIRR